MLLDYAPIPKMFNKLLLNQFSSLNQIAIVYYDPLFPIYSSSSRYRATVWDIVLASVLIHFLMESMDLASCFEYN